MAGLFQPKRVQVPGLLSDDGLAAALKEFSATTKQTAQAAPPNTSAVEASDRILTEALKAEPGLRQVSPRAPQGGGTLQLSPAPAAPKRGPGLGLELLNNAAGEIVKAGTLTPDQQVDEQQKIIDEAKAQEKAVGDTVTLRDDIASIIDEGRTSEGLMASQEELATIRAGQSAQEASKAAAFVKEAETTLPTQTWWLNAAQVSARSAAQMGVSALRFPGDVWDTAVALSKGEDKVAKSDYSAWLDGVDKTLTNMLPGDKARSKQFVSELAAGGGSMVGFLITGFAGRVVGLPAALTTGTLGAAVEGDSLYQEADGFSANATQKMIALVLGSGLGVTEAIPIDRAFMRADAASGGAIRNLLANTTASSLEEFIQEASQSLGEDIVAKYGAAYDPTREISADEILKNGVIGAITGGVVGGATTLLSGGQEVDAVQMDEAKQTEVVDAALAEEDVRFAAILGDELDGEGAVETPAPGASGEAPAGGETAAARPDPVAVPDKPRGDAVQEIVKPTNVPKTEQVSEETAGVAAQRTIETPEFQAFFDGSKVVNEVGAPKVVYHSTRGDFTQFDTTRSEFGAHFGGASQANTISRGDGRPGESVMPGSRTVPVFLSVKNPLRLEDTGSFDNREVARQLQEQGILTPKEAKALRAQKPANTKAMQSKLAELGYDGVVYLNRREGVSAKPEDQGDFETNATDEAFKERYPLAEDSYIAFEPTQIKSAIANTGTFDPTNPNIDQQVADPITAAVNGATPEATELSPLPNIENGLTGPIPMVVKAARAYAAAAGLPLRRQREYVKVDTARAARIAQAYADMKHEPADPAVQAAYKALAEETIAQYRYVLATGLKIESMKDGQPDPYEEGPRAVLKDIAAGHIWYFPTKFGFGSDASFDPSTNPLLEETEFKNDAGETMLVNDLFRVVHDFFGHGMEGSGFGPRGEENAWQSHMRLFSQSAVPAMTSETRGQNSWVNYGPFGAANRANPKETVYADQKTGLMPSWTWQEGIEDSQAYVVSAPVEIGGTITMADTNIHDNGEPLAVHHFTYNAFGRFDRQFAARFFNRDPENIDRVGIWFTTNPQAKYAGESMGGRRVDAYLKMKTPKYYDDEAVAGKSAWEQLNDDVIAAGSATALRNDLKARGFDGIAMPGTKLDGFEQTVLLAFDPEQIVETKASAAGTFHAALSAAVAESKYGAVVKVYSPAKYAKMRLFLSPDGRSGFALDGEDIVSVFSRGGGQLRKIIDAAVANGGRTLDAFDTGLPKMYASLGFRETKREPWNPAYAPKDWPAELGKPDVVYMEYAPGEIEQQSAVLLRRGTETLKPFGLDSARSATVRQVAQALELRQQKQAGRIDRKDYSTKASNRIAKWMAEEVAFEMEHPDISGVGWYSEKFQAALDKFSDVFPELATDKDARDMLTLFIAITSDGQKVVPNFAQAIDIYGNYRRTGKLSTGRGHARQSSIDSNMAHIQKLLETHKTPAALREYLLKEDTVANLRKDAKAADGDFKSAYKADVKLPRAAVELGPKLGAFYANLMGAQGYLTMDRWWSRTFNRYRGDLLDAPTKAGLDRVRSLLGQPGLTDEQVVEATIPYRQSYEEKGFKNGTELEKAANTLYKAAFEGLNDQPFSASDRSFMIDTVTQAQKVLKKQGIEITIADIQAVLWYYEKRLYGELGARQSADISYEEAAARVVANQAETATLDSANEIDLMTGTATARNPYVAEPTRPTKGIPSPTPALPNQEDVRLSKISSNFVKVLDLTARHGRLAGPSKVMGEYNRRTATIRLRTWTDFSTLVHEGGHALNDSMAAPLDAFVKRNSGDINKASKLYAGDLSQAPVATVMREGFAEFFRAYVTNPPFARRHWPAMTADFEATVKAADPKVLDGLNSISAQFAAWVQLPSRQLIRNMVVDGRRESGIDAAVKELRDVGFKGWMSEYARRATATMVNKYVAVADLEAQLLNLGEENRGAPLDLKRSESPTAILRLARNGGSRAQVQITDGVIGYRSTQSMSRGLREALMTALNIDPATTPGSLDEELMKDFDAYIVARRAFDEFRRFDAGEIERPPIGAQKGDVMRTIKEYEKEQPQFIPAAQIVHEYGMAMWQKRYDAGLMDKDTYEEGLQRQFYAPLQRDVSDKQGNGADSISFGGSVLTKGPRFKGSDRDIISPMTVLMQMTFALEKQISENDAKRALAVLADRAGQAGALVERIPASQLIGQSFTVQQVASRLTADASLTAADASDLMTILAGSIDKGDLMTLFRSEQAGTQGENVLFFWENGKIAAIRLNDTSLASDVVNTMNAVGRENMDVLLEAVAATSTVFRTAITSWPDFLLVNYIRDQMSAWVLGGTGYVPFVSGIQGIADEIRQKQWAKSYNAAGGTMGGMTVASLHQARVDRDINALRTKGYIANVFGEMNGGWSNIPGAIKGLGRLTALTETGTRLGLYRGAYNRAIEDGLSEYDASIEAAYTATDYIDFGLNGSKMLHARRLVPFLNAQLQGLYKMYRTLGGDEVARRKGLRFALGAYFKNINNLPLSRLEKQQLRTGRGAWLKMMALGLIGAALWAIFRDDPDYQEVSEYVRVTHWVIPIGDGKIIAVPKPFELALVSNAVERGLEMATGDTTAMDRFMRGVGLTMIPPTAPPAIQSAVEVAANYDFFTGRAIVPDYMQALQPQLQYDNYTSSLAKWVGGVTGQSPMVVDHVMAGLGASAYRDITTILNAADPTRPMPAETDWPILRRFVRDVRRGSTSAQDFWKQASTTNGALERAAKTYDKYKEMGNEPAANRFLDTLTADQRAYAVLMTDFKPEEKRLSPFYRARQVGTIVSGMRRENGSALGLGDTTNKLLPGEAPATFQLPRRLRTQVDTILSEIARREVRNTMIVTGQPGWVGKEVLPLQPTLDMLLAVSPDAYDEYQRRLKKSKVYDAETVFEYWPDIRDRLVTDGPDAVLADAVAVAGVVF